MIGLKDSEVVMISVGKLVFVSKVFTDIVVSVG